RGAAVVIVGGGVTGLSAGWWLARAGVDVLVLDKGIVGWEASGRNGGGATHVYSPFGLEEQRLWPQMDELLGYPTEYQPCRIGVALSEAQLALARRWAEIGEARGFRWESLDRRQTLRGNLVYGGGPHEWVNVPGMATPEHANTPLVRSLARRLGELFPGAAHVRVIRAWSGLVENTPDGLPVVERLARPDNVVLATMSSVGFGLSPAVGRAISELVEQGRCRFADLGALPLS